MGVLGSFYNLNPCRKTYLDILATSLGSQVAKKGEIKPPKSKKTNVPPTLSLHLKEQLMMLLL